MKIADKTAWRWWKVRPEFLGGTRTTKRDWEPFFALNVSNAFDQARQKWPDGREWLCEGQTIEKPPCKTCDGKGEVPKKVWQELPNIPGIHPAILAGTQAQRTIKYFKCPDCEGKS